MSESSANGVGVQTSLSATTGAAVSLTIPTYTDAREGTKAMTPRHALIGIEGNSVRFTVDGTAPTASIGILLPAGTIIDWSDAMMDYNALITRVQFIGISGTATLNVQFRS